MSQVITARLARNDAQPWGFRLQGGKDFGTPLVIQKVSNFKHVNLCEQNFRLEIGTLHNLFMFNIKIF